MLGALKFVRHTPLLAGICCVALVFPAAAADGTGAQHQAAEEYLVAVAAGDARSMAQSIHVGELQLLRQRLLDEMKLEADRNEGQLRTRLFGAGMLLSDIEHLTPENFFVALAQRLRFSGRAFERVDWLAAVADSGGMVQLVGRAVPPKGSGTVRALVVVSLIPWGKDWKAAIPLELQAQIDDLRSGRVRATVPALPAATAVQVNPPQILELLQAAEGNLTAGRCEDFYNGQMSPEFRRTMAAKALRSLITTCEGRADVRERLLIVLRLARGAAPRFEYSGTRAVYDLGGQNPPFSKLVLELLDKHWYIAE